jgi:hypothetical protein
MSVTYRDLINTLTSRLGVRSSKSHHKVGDVTSFGTDYVHDVDFESGRRPAVSIHAYSPPLHCMTFYDHTPYGFVAREVVPEERRTEFRTTQPEVSR